MPPSNRPKILFLCPTTTQPRYAKRITAAQIAGFDVTVAAFNRGYYRANKLPLGVTTIDLPAVEDGKYLLRAFALWSAYRQLRQLTIRHNYSIIYSFGTDILALALKLNRRHLIHEIGDLRTVAARHYNPLVKLLAGFERRMLRKVDRLVITSIAFADYLQPSFEKPDAIVEVLENLLSPQLLNVEKVGPTITETGPIRIGLVGLLRYRNIFTLTDVIAQTQNQDRFTLDIWGDGPLARELEQRIKGCPNIQYHGPYSYVNDTKRIYEQIDLSYVVYDSSQVNVRLALPNKLYESLYFGIPLIAADSTFLADEVGRLGIGYAVKAGCVTSLQTLLDSLHKQDLAIMQQRALHATNRDKLFDQSAELFHRVAADLGIVGNSQV